MRACVVYSSENDLLWFTTVRRFYPELAVSHIKILLQLTTIIIITILHTTK